MELERPGFPRRRGRGSGEPRRPGCPLGPRRGHQTPRGPSWPGVPEGIWGQVKLTGTCAGGSGEGCGHWGRVGDESVGNGADGSPGRGSFPGHEASGGAGTLETGRCRASCDSPHAAAGVRVARAGPGREGATVPRQSGPAVGG